MYIALAVLIALHGFAHLVGFMTPFGLLRDGVQQTALLSGRIHTSDATMRMFGILWLAAAILFVIAAIGLIRRDPWWQPTMLATSLLSLALSIAFMPDSKIGAAIDVGLIAFLLANQSFGWIGAGA